MVSLKPKSLQARVKLRQKVGSDGLTSFEREQRAKRYLDAVCRRPSDADLDAIKDRMKARREAELRSNEM